VTAAEEFIEFATGASPRLRRTAFLLCGNWHTAEDLAQTTLAKMYASWRRIRAHEHVYAYANRTLVNSYLADRRRLRARELLAGWLPERPAEPQTPELRIEVLNALVTLPPKARVVVLMRYWADMSVTAGRPIEVGSRGHGDDPNGETVYVVNASFVGTVTPIDVATNTAEPRIKVAAGPLAIVIAP
jgi:RNA polymerase sigma factor (sigma-70 family)